MGPSQQLDNGMANNIMLQCLSFVTVTFSASVTASLYHRGTVSQMSYDNYVMYHRHSHFWWFPKYPNSNFTDKSWNCQLILTANLSKYNKTNHKCWKWRSK